MSDRTQDRGRAAAVDGLRAVAALSVLGYHAWLYTRDRVSAGVRGSLADELAHELRLGLVLFFVLSGYLLYGPWVRAALDRAAAPRTAAYLVRRAARIVPAYYAAVAGSIVLLWGLDATPGVRLPAADDLWLFALFGQNFSVDTLLSLNAPLWTLAVEWSFYLMLPVLGWLALRLRGASREAQAIVPALFLVAGVALELVDRRRGGPAHADQGAARDGAVLRRRDARRAAGPRAGARAPRRLGPARRRDRARGRRRVVGGARRARGLP